MVAKIVPPEKTYYSYLGGGSFFLGGGWPRLTLHPLSFVPLAPFAYTLPCTRPLWTYKEESPPPTSGPMLSVIWMNQSGLRLFSRRSVHYPLNECSPSAGWMRASGLIFNPFTPVESEQRRCFGFSVGKQGRGGVPVYPFVATGWTPRIAGRWQGHASHRGRNGTAPKAPLPCLCPARFTPVCLPFIFISREWHRILSVPFMCTRQSSSHNDVPWNSNLDSAVNIQIKFDV